MRGHRERRALEGMAAALAVLLTASLLPPSPAEPAAAISRASAHAARSLNGNDTAHLHLVRPEGSQIYEEGPVAGSLPGSMRATLDVGALYTGSFTIRTHGGSIRGHGRATPNGAGRYQSFRGSFLVTGGSGRYAHVSGHAGLYGVFDRRTDSVIIQTTGKLSY